MVEPALRQITSPSNHRCRSRRTEWRASNVKWKDDARPPANIFPTIIFLIYIAREIALQDHRAEMALTETCPLLISGKQHRLGDPRFRTFQVYPKDLRGASGASLACGKLAQRVARRRDLRLRRLEDS